MATLYYSCHPSYAGTSDSKYGEDFFRCDDFCAKGKNHHNEKYFPIDSNSKSMFRIVAAKRARPKKINYNTAYEQ